MLGLKEKTNKQKQATDKVKRNQLKTSYKQLLK